MDFSITNNLNSVVHESTINKTKKRNSKSVELPHKQYSLMQTNRTLQLSQNPRHVNSLQIVNDKAFTKNREANISCELMTEKIKLSPKMINSEQVRDQNEQNGDAANSMVPSRSQIIGAFNFKDLSGVFPE